MNPFDPRPLALVALMVGTTPGPLRADPAPEVWRGLASRLSYAPFKSKEELLQLFQILFVREGRNTFSMLEPDLKVLAKTVKTLFPIEHCTGIRFKQERLWMSFDGPQSVAVPNSWGQVRVVLSPEVCFRVRRETSNPNTLVFSIESGSVDLKFSFLARWFKGMPNRFHGSRLAYTLDESRRESAIRLEEEEIIPRQNLVVAREKDHFWIDIRTPAFPDPVDLESNPGEVHFLYLHARIQPDGSLLINGRNVTKSAESAQEFSKLQETIRAIAEGNSDLHLSRELNYEMEAHSFSLGMRMQPEE